MGSGQYNDQSASEGFPATANLPPAVFQEDTRLGGERWYMSPKFIYPDSNNPITEPCLQSSNLSLIVH